MRASFLLWVAVFGLAACHKVDESTSGPSTPPPITTNNLRGLWGSGPNDVWAAGDKGTILHFDGKAWALSPSGTTEDLTCITGTGPTNVYISGQKGAILHWDGQGWTQVSGGNETTRTPRQPATSRWTLPMPTSATWCARFWATC